MFMMGFTLIIGQCLIVHCGALIPTPEVTSPTSSKPAAGKFFVIHCSFATAPKFSTHRHNKYDTFWKHNDLYTWQIMNVMI